jgi:hypothetical protein
MYRECRRSPIYREDDYVRSSATPWGSAHNGGWAQGLRQGHGTYDCALTGGCVRRGVKGV